MARAWTNPVAACAGKAMTPVCHGEDPARAGDVAIHLELQLDCRARQAGLAMTIPV